MTASFKHYKGESLQCAGLKFTNSHTWKATGTGSAKAFAGELGYVFQKQSESSVLDTISATLSTGWYYYEQRVRSVDFKYTSWTNTYKKNKKGIYVFDSTGASTTQYTVALSGQTYCTWVFDPYGKD